MFKNLAPTRGAFVEVLAAHTDRLVAGANATLRLISGLGNPSESNQALIEELAVHKRGADALKDDFIHMLFEAFTTPIQREQLHALVLDLDRTLDALLGVANAIEAYRIRASTAEARKIASLAADACHRLNRAVIALADRNSPMKVIDLCREVEALEELSIQAMREGVTKLFANEGDEAAAWHAMKMRGFYFAQESVLDGCKQAARRIEEILLDSA